MENKTLTDLAQAQQKLDDVIHMALRMGADAADALYVEGQSLSVSWRDGKIESLDHAEGGDLGLRVFVGKRQAVVATTDHSPKTLEEIVARAVSMAKAATEDPFCGIADPQEIAHDFPSLELADAYVPDVDIFTQRAREAEDAALAVEGVVQCDSTHAGGGRTSVALAASNGFAGAYSRTNYWISASALVGKDTEMEHDYDYDSVAFQSDLMSASDIGRRAAQNALRNLGPRKMPSCQVPVVFDPRVANSILGAFIGAINGSGIARGTSFLKDQMGKQVFAGLITIMDDPHRARGLRSKMFDAEGLAPVPRKLIDQGVLTTWLLDLRSARQLGLKSTGHGSRGASGTPSPSPTNVYIQAGELSPEALISDIKSGFYVTDLMGHGVNGVTGDFSQAAKGFWIENGQKAFPVSEMTIAANLKDMFLSAQVANDLAFRYGLDSPTMRIDGMTVAGS